MTDNLAWHFLRADGRLRDGAEPPPDGVALVHAGPLVLCRCGLHACKSALDALGYAPGPVICRVRCAGALDDDGDQLVCRSRTILWRADATRVLREFAADCAERALLHERAAGREPDPRSWAAVEVTRCHARGEATAAELEAAGAVAWAARAAEAVAWAAAGAWMAARTARAARCGEAWTEERAWQRVELERRMLALGPGATA
jgi:hypothetical protein